MLPKPHFSFTIPSIHDNANLECRIYHPVRGRSKPWDILQKRGAIFAHPYAPLGGCSDDPVVASVGLEILEAGYVLGTFNFRFGHLLTHVELPLTGSRGAGASQGSTSWTARGELADYVSFAGLFLLYLQGLDATAIHDLDTRENSKNDSTAFESSESIASSALKLPTDAPPETVIVFGGYSYGSMICMNLPPATDIAAHFRNPSPSSSQAEVVLRASHLSKQRKQDLLSAQSSHITASQESLRDSLHSTRIGGDESEHSHFKSGKKSRHSLHTFKRNLDLPKGEREAEAGNLANPSDSMSISSSQTEPGHSTQPIMHCRYLLVSPLLPPISSFATMFTRLKAPQAIDSRKAHQDLSSNDSASSDPNKKLTENLTIAIYGDHDTFTSQKKLRRWAESLKQVNSTCFEFHEVAHAGHFWHEDGVEKQMKIFIKHWLEKVCLV